MKSRKLFITIKASNVRIFLILMNALRKGFLFQNSLVPKNNPSYHAAGVVFRN